MSEEINGKRGKGGFYMAKRPIQLLLDYPFNTTPTWAIPSIIKCGG
jgi:hypothetical protein